MNVGTAKMGTPTLRPSQQSQIHTGAVGESIVATELLWHGWSPANANGIVRNAPNVDFLAAKDDLRVALQVKTAGLNSRSMLQLGYKNEGSVFNSKPGPTANFIVFVRLLEFRSHECYVVPTDVAEAAVAVTAEDWLRAPKRDGSKRDENFPLCIRFEPNKNRPEVSNFKERWASYRNAWNVLEAKN